MNPYILSWVVVSSNIFAMIACCSSMQKENRVGLILTLGMLTSSLLKDVSVMKCKHALDNEIFFSNLNKKVIMFATYYGIIRLVAHPHLLSFSFVVKICATLFCMFLLENILTGPWFLHIMFTQQIIDVFMSRRYYVRTLRI